ncbi:phenylalanine--tRNA ligase beta subunit-related protein [Actinomycetes bacterium KLBMP 9797]
MSRHFAHAPDIWADYPELAAGVVHATGITPDVDTGPAVARFSAAAAARLGGGSESDLPEIRAWRRGFARMGLKPTQYRCASEALLRRFRKEGELPRIHPLVDLCNAISLAFAIPVAAIDLDRIDGALEVRYATGAETYLAFSGVAEHPDPREVIFADAGGGAHARRWTNRQSGQSAVRDGTRTVLIVAEALHESAASDTAKLAETVADELRAAWAVPATTATLSATSAHFPIP